MSTTFRRAAILGLSMSGACQSEAPQERKGEDPPMVLKAAAESAKPEPEPEPSPDADALLEDARNLQFKDPATAYDKAKASYDDQPRPEALWVMGFAACRLRDTEKASFVLDKLSGDDATKLRDNCAQKGVELPAPG